MTDKNIYLVGLSDDDIYSNNGHSSDYWNRVLAMSAEEAVCNLIKLGIAKAERSQHPTHNLECIRDYRFAGVVKLIPDVFGVLEECDIFGSQVLRVYLDYDFKVNFVKGASENA